MSIEDDKIVSFGVTAPTDAFTGRNQELQKIRQQFNTESNLIVIGLSGIGKTQLVKKFIEEYGDSDFHGRVFWIAAESNKTVENSFEHLAPLLNIQNVYHKNIRVLIDEVFQYFEGVKVLFVFDNFDTSSVYKGDLVKYCWTTASDPTKNGRPYFLFISRNQNCLSNLEIPILDLNVLSQEEAIQLIRTDLTEMNPNDAKKLAEILQCFPLALRQAIAYVKQQQQIRNEDYFAKLNNLLAFKFPDNFGQNEKITFITWNVTLDAIKADNKVNGENAIQVLKIFAYLYPDKIDPIIVLPLFENDEGKTANALLLLENYSMITKVTQEQRNFYQIHRLVQAVVQLTFQNESDVIQEQAFKLINPELYEALENYDKENGMEMPDDDGHEEMLLKLMQKCSTDQIFHFNTLSLNMHPLKRKYENFFNLLNDSVLWWDDDVEKVTALEIPANDWKNFMERRIYYLIKYKCNKIIKYFIDSGQLGVNDRLKDKSLIKWSVEQNNVEILKYLIEHGVKLSEILESASLELVSGIKDGKLDSLQSFIKKTANFNQHILKECLFFAVIVNKDAIIELLLQNIVEPKNLQYKRWTLIEVGARLGFNNSLQILLPRYDSEHLKECLRKLVKERYFSDTETFETIYKKYLENGVHLHDKDLIWAEFCDNFDIDKVNLAHFLINIGADLTFSRTSGPKGFARLLEKHEDDCLKEDDKHRLDQLLNQIIFDNLTHEKFINVSQSIFQIEGWSSKEFFRKLFEKMVEKITDINVRNKEGDTLLTKYLKDRYSLNIATVKYLVEHGIAVDAQDNDGNSALYFSVRKFEIFKYLWPFANSLVENVLENVIREDNNKFLQKLLENHLPADYCLEKPLENGEIGKIPLIQVALESVSPKIVCLLKDAFKKYREQGGNVNVRNEHGETLLNRLLYKRYDGDFDDMKFLIENGVDVDIRDNDDESALYRAAINERKDIFLYLLTNSKSVDEDALVEAIKRRLLSKVEDLPPNSDINTRHLLNKLLNKLEMGPNNSDFGNGANNEMQWEAQDDVEK